MIDDLDAHVAKAVRSFWTQRNSQSRRQGSATGERDRGNRAAATGGRHLDGFTKLFEKIVRDAGAKRGEVFTRGRADLTIPGFFRPTKQWDLLVICGGKLVAAVECKSLCGPSFGNNYNNRIEEAVGNATDFWTAHREEAFGTAHRPFAGYFLLLEEADTSTRPVAASNKHFDVFEEFQHASYAERCAESLRRLLLERCYDAASLILAMQPKRTASAYQEPLSELAFRELAVRLHAHVRAVVES